MSIVQSAILSFNRKQSTNLIFSFLFFEFLLTDIKKKNLPQIKYKDLGFPYRDNYFEKKLLIAKSISSLAQAVPKIDFRGPIFRLSGGRWHL